MRKIFFVIFALFFLEITSFGQIKEIRFGGIAAVTASTDFRGPFEKNFNLTAQSAVIMKKGFASLMYSFGGNAIGTLDGIFLPKNWDAYVVGFKNLKDNGGYLGLGIEKLFPLGEDVKIFLFTEVGTNLKFKEKFLTFGVLLNTSGVIWKKKT